jgi:hypothetical protein
MDLTRYTFLNGNKFEIVLGKISDISNQYLILEYRVADKKSASGKTYSVIEMSNTNQFFDSSATGLFIKDSSAITSSSIYKDDLIGSVVRYELDKYLFSGIWLNTYAQLNIPSPIFFNVENVMNDLRMMYFGKQSEDEILNSIRKNWYDKKYQNDLRIPLIDISKKFSDEFSIIDEPRDKDKLLDYISSSKKEKKVESPSTLANNFNIVRPNDDESNTNEFFSYFREGNVFLVQRETQINFDFSNDYTKEYEYVMVYIDEDQNISNNKLVFYPSLLVKKDNTNYDAYLELIRADYLGLSNNLYFKVGDFIRQDIEFSIKEKYEIGTILYSKSKYIIIGAYYDINNELKYLSVSVSVFTSNNAFTTNAMKKKVKTWSESEIDDLAKKKKVSIVSPTKSSYFPKEYLSGDLQTSNPFQQQTMAKLSDELDSVRNKNEVLYNAFINVINAINKKIQDKIPQTKSSSKTDLYGISLKSSIVANGIFLGFNLQDALKEEIIGKGIGVDDFILSAFDENNNSSTPYKYFINTDDLINYCGKLLKIFVELAVLQKELGGKPRQNFFRPIFYNLPLFTQMLSFTVDTRNSNTPISYQGTTIYDFQSGFLQKIANFSIEKQLSFYVNIIRQCLNMSYIQRLRYELLVDFRPNDDWKKSLIILNPYFTLDYEFLKAVGCRYVVYKIRTINSNQTISYGDTETKWIDKLKYTYWSDIPEEIRNEVFGDKPVIVLYEEDQPHEKSKLIDLFQKYDQTSLDVFNGAPLPKMPVDAEPDDFLSQIDEIDFSDNSLFVDSIVDEVNNLDFDDPDLFN